MHQLLHLLIVDHDGRTALADMHDKKWLLPIVSCSERIRAVSVIQRWAERQNVDGEMIGQWLGRVTVNADAIDWLVVVRATARAFRASSPQLSWIPLESLRASDSMFHYQGWAISRATTDGRSPEVPGPFGTLAWPDCINAWIENVAGTDARIAVVYRAGPYELVSAVSTRDGPAYFKGLAPGRASEARLTSVLAAAMPESFAPTRVLTPQADGSTWWLAAGCAGTPLARCLTPEQTQRVAGACARVQNKTATLPIPAADLPHLDLPDAAAWSIDLLRRTDRIDDVDESCGAIASAFDDVNKLLAPYVWIPMDLDPANVLIGDDGAVRFIDLDDSYLGPAALAMATFGRRVRRLDSNGAIAIEALYQAYEQSWSWSPLGRGAWQTLEIVSMVLEAHHGWQRVVENAARAELYGPIDLIAERIAQRLARAFKTQTEVACPVISKPVPGYARRI
ncbi:MAG TPA: hypothetical protein VG222_18285 [Vicinamibacterales bacterium]|jgi:hypothetical protein|nr:hypothetical protein [Vicinamibacterales bacterium]